MTYKKICNGISVSFFIKQRYKIIPIKPNIIHKRLVNYIFIKDEKFNKKNIKGRSPY